jgi:hypothetical protein
MVDPTPTPDDDQRPNAAVAHTLWSLAGIVVVSIAIAVPLAAVLAGPLIYVSESVLHLGCTQNTIDGQQVWVCPDRIGYAIPGMALVALLTILGIAIGVYAQRDRLSPRRTRDPRP